MSFDMQQPLPDGLLPQSIRFWCDPIPRGGYENMAADELLSRRSEAWLRIYGWARPAVSFGYFDSSPVAAALFPGEGVEYIRRWTGGGIVDHRKGYTYTVTLPAREGCIYPPADKLYKWIHGALAQALRASGVSCSLLVEDAPDGGRACWASPVASDIVDEAGHKLAGAGQRRYRGAVLHQGLIQECEPAEGWSMLLAQALVPEVDVVIGDEPYPGFADDVAELCRTKYCTAEWNDETHGRRRQDRS